MTTPELPQQPPLTAETPLVTVVPNLNILEISGLVEDPVERTHRWERDDVAEEAGDRLAMLYMTMGEGVFTLDQIKEKTGLYGRNVTPILTQLANALPAEIFASEGKGKDRRIILGSFRIAARLASNEEKDAWTASLEAQQKDGEAEKREATLAAEAHKTNMIDIDHALVRVGEKTYYIPMPIAGLDGIVAVRAIEAIKDMHQSARTPVARYAELVKRMWENMPLAERRLFTGSEKQLYGTGHVLSTSVRDFVKHAGQRLGVAESSKMQSDFLLGNSDISVEIMPEPPEKPYDPATVEAVYPPGSEKLLVRSNNLGETPPDEADAIKAVLEKVLDARHLTHDDAIDILDIVMDKRCKVFARRILSERFTAGDVHGILERLTERSQAALGYQGFKAARKQRTIGGNLGASRVQLIARRLPADRTFKHIGESLPDVTRKWQYGSPTD